MPNDKQTTSDQPLRDAACSRCIWCGKDKRKMSNWEQQHTSGSWHQLCNPCANRRLKNPYNALLNLRKIPVPNDQGQARVPEEKP